METTLRVLMVGDSDSEVERTVRHLELAGCVSAHERVDTAAAMGAALDKSDWDVIIANHNMLRFGALAALRLLQETGHDIPFIVVSDSMGEDAAVTMMKAGAQDIVMKEHLARLIFAVRRELDDAEARRRRRQAEEALRESEERYRTILESIEDSYFECDLAGNLTFFNASTCRTLGYSAQELHGKHLKELMDDSTGRELKGLFEGVFQSGRAVRLFQHDLKRKDGSRARVETSVSLIRDAQGKPVGFRGVGRDITERKRAEQDLLKERERLATALDGNPIPTFMIDQDHRVVFWNRALELFSSIPREQALGRPAGESLSASYLGHSPPILADLMLDLTDAELLRRYGHEVRRGPVGEAFEVTTYMWSQGEKRILEILATRIRDHQGALVGALQCGQDVTDKVQLRKQLQYAQKMEALGTLAGGIAHDFNNLLTAIMGFSQMALSHITDEGPLAGYLKQVREAGSRATDLVKQILTFCRQTEQERKPVPVAPIVQEALKLLRSSIPATIAIHSDITMVPQESVVRADPTQVHQVLMNLGTNAAHAMRTRGGVLGVTLETVVADSALVSRFPELLPGPYVKLTVSDTGHGMEPAVMERIFDPYFTTKGLGEGTGLGLAVVQGIVKGYGGIVAVNSEPGRGATFEVLLPRIQDEIAAEAHAAEVLPTGNERILFVDDESSLADLGEEMLESLGYQVTVKTSSVEALETFRAQPDAFDLVITDMTMPRLTGKELAGELMAIRANIPIILCTGFSELISEAQAKAAGIREYVLKPYIIESLAKTIRKVLAET